MNTIGVHGSAPEADRREVSRFLLLSRHFGISVAGDRGRAKAGGVALVSSLALGACLSSHPEHLLRNIAVKLKLEAMGGRSDPLTHGTLNVLLKK